MISSLLRSLLRHRATPVLACAVAFVALALPGLRRESATYDENAFLFYGHRLLVAGELGRDDTLNSKMPWNALQALPGWLRERSTGQPAFVLEGGVVNVTRASLDGGRCVSLGTGVVLLLLLAALARRLGGDRAMAATVLLGAFDPGLLAHARYATTDVAAAATTLLVGLAAVAFGRSPDARRAALLGAALGVALLAKYTALHVALGLGAGLVAWSRARAGPPFGARAAAAMALAAVVAALLVVDAGYLFQELPGRLPDPPRSRALAAVAPVVPPLPVSGHFLEGLDRVAADADAHGIRALWFLGERDPGKRGWFLYYPVVFALKTPLPVLVLLALAAAGACGKGPAKRRRPLAPETWLLLGPAVEMVLYFVLVFRMQIGLRHLLPVTTLALLPAGAALARLASGSPGARSAALALVLWLVASVLSFSPSYLPYVNEVVADRLSIHRLFADSNLDWGQERDAAAAWVRAERARGRVVHVQPPAPVAGTVVVSANELLGLSGEDRYAWLRPLRPTAHIGYAILVFEVRPEDLPPR